jgi:hypothetical protein
MAGYLISLAIFNAVGMLVADLLIGVNTPNFLRCSANFFLSSDIWTAEIGEPRISTLCFFRIPFSFNSSPQFRAVCPPKEIKIASGFSFFNNFFYKKRSNWEEINSISEQLGRLNSCYVWINQNCFNAFFFQGFNGLRS